MDFPPKGKARQVLASKMDGLQPGGCGLGEGHSSPPESQGEAQGGLVSPPFTLERQAGD